jgi:Icc-related predicted phosphoesterase
MHRKSQRFKSYLNFKANQLEKPRHGIRIVCLSDTHCRTDAIEVPEGDVLIVAGDICSRGHPSEARDFDQFLARMPHGCKLLVAGNHDFPFEYCSKRKAKALVKHAIYLENSGVERFGLKFWGSPWQPEFYNWAFNLPRGKPLAEIWGLIPDDTDVLITHTPPYGILDRLESGRHVGCVDLAQALPRVRPKLHVFGHIHEDYGMQEQNGTTFINACICNAYYQPVNPPIVFDL